MRRPSGPLPNDITISNAQSHVRRHGLLTHHDPVSACQAEIQACLNE